MYEIVKTVNGYNITRMIGTRGFYTVHFSANKSRVFRTIKAAAAFCETL